MRILTSSQVWFAHKLACGADSKPFRLPLLSVEEGDELIRRKDEQPGNGYATVSQVCQNLLGAEKGQEAVRFNFLFSLLPTPTDFGQTDVPLPYSSSFAPSNKVLLLPANLNSLKVSAPPSVVLFMSAPAAEGTARSLGRPLPPEAWATFRSRLSTLSTPSLTCSTPKPVPAGHAPSTRRFSTSLSRAKAVSTPSSTTYPSSKRPSSTLRTNSKRHLLRLLRVSPSSRRCFSRSSSKNRLERSSNVLARLTRTSGGAWRKQRG
jgi:hypothetical protein